MTTHRILAACIAAGLLAAPGAALAASAFSISVEFSGAGQVSASDGGVSLGNVSGLAFASATGQTAVAGARSGFGMGPQAFAGATDGPASELLLVPGLTLDMEGGDIASLLGVLDNPYTTNILMGPTD